MRLTTGKMLVSYYRVVGGCELRCASLIPAARVKAGVGFSYMAAMVCSQSPVLMRALVCSCGVASLVVKGAVVSRRCEKLTDATLCSVVVLVKVTDAHYSGADQAVSHSDQFQARG